MTGLEHNVPPGHFSLTDPEYEVLPEKAVPTPKLEPASKAAAAKRKPKKK